MSPPLRSRRRFLTSLQGVLLGLAVAIGVSVRGAEPVTFVFTSDVHFGLHRGQFRGAANVAAPVVSAAMVEAINRLPAATFPNDGGLRAGRPIGPVDFVTITGDLTNRQERLPLRIQSASESWAQFERVFFGGLKLVDRRGQPAPLLLVPGNHDVSNAIGHPNGLLPATDATTLAELYNRMLHPAQPRTKDTYRFATDRICFSRDFGGAHFVFLSLWPDEHARAWMEADLKSVPSTTPVFLFAHDPPKVDARHFTNPNGDGGINDRDKFENVIGEVYADGRSADGPTVNAQRRLVAFLKAHRNIVGYFHGHANWTEFYTWKGPDQDIALAAFRADSPMKGRESGKDETKLSFQVVVVDVATGKLTARECRWNPAPAARGAPPSAWGQVTTVDIRPRLAGLAP